MNTLSKTQVQERLIKSLAIALYLQPSEIDPEKSFTDLGLDSIVGVEWIKTINKEFSLELSSTKVYDYATINKLTGYLISELGDQLQVVEESETKAEITPQKNTQSIPVIKKEIKVEEKKTIPFTSKTLESFPVLGKKERKKQQPKTSRGFEDEKIAIVGISGRYPDAKNLDEYWANLKSGKNSIKEIPKSRWNVDDYYDADLTKKDKVYCKWLGMLDDVDKFDPLFFQISPAEAEVMDPQHRLFLEESYKAFEDAGYARRTLSDKKCGVYMGIMSNEYAHLMATSNSTNVNTTANSFAIGAARIAYFLNLKGPAIPFDTACSSSLVAIHVACQGLLNNEVDMALAGGVSLYLIPESYVGMCQAGMLSPDGQCKTFDNGANGFVPGEGAGAVVLKRLKDAERDQDHIYGVILGSGINQDGKTNGITAPSVNSQIALEREIYDRYQIHPESISYIEAHGTGTKLGDPIELEALSTVYKEKTTNKNYCAIGSVKSNIGHTSGAAGVASLHKVLLCMQNKTLVPSLNVEKENDIFNFEESPFYISREQKPWVLSSENQLRRAAISSFGFSGTNAHLVIEEYPQSTKEKESVQEEHTSVIIPLSARTNTQLQELAKNLVAHISSNRYALNHVDVAYTLQTGREELKQRLGIVVSSVQELEEKLEAYISGQNTIPDFYESNVAKGKETLTAFESNTSFNELVKQWIREKNNNKLAELWVNGFELDWEQLHGNAQPSKISLPTYPFAKERYWVSSLEKTSKVHSDTKKQVVASTNEKPVALHYTTEWKELALKPNVHKEEEGGLLFLGTNDTLYKTFTNQYPNRTKVCFVQLGKEFSNTAPNEFSINPENEEDVEQLFAALERIGIIPTKIIHQAPIFPDLEEQHLVDTWLADGIISLFTFCKAFIKLKKQQEIQLISFSEVNENLTNTLNEAAGAFFKTLALEHAKFQAKVVVIEKGISHSVEEKLNLVLAEFSDTHKQNREIKYVVTDNSFQRYARTIVPFEPIKSTKENIPVKQQGVYLISGGTGGIGRGIANYLAKTYQCTLVLFGRSEITTEIEKTLNQLKAYNAEAIYIPTDVTDAKQVENLVKTVKEKFTHIHGVIHSAGVQNDNFILKKSTEEFRKVIHPKIQGTIHLDWATREEQLDVFVVFSSIAGVLGNYGQADYAYANNFLDSYAQFRNSQVKRQTRFGRTLSINWPYWEEGGFQLSENEIAQGKKQLGIYPINNHLGLTYFEQYIGSEKSQNIALYGIQSKINEYLQIEKKASTPKASNQERLIDSALLLDKTTTYLKELVGNEIKLEVDRIDIEEQFDVFGIDSIVIGNMNIKLENDLGPLSKTVFYEYPTIKELAAFLSEDAKDVLIQFFGLKETTSLVVEEEIQEINPGGELEETVVQVSDIHSSEPIAIIGLHGKYPKSDDITKYWENLKKGKNLVGIVPESRWNAEELYDENPEKVNEGKIYSKWGGFVNDVDTFDPKFFNITPEEAKMMDPQERLFLQSVWATIEDAGYTKQSLKTQYSKGRGSDVGVFVGVTTNTYNILATDQWAQGNYINSSAMSWSIANRISYLMDFQGPSMPIDTACSSSLVAIHLACESIRKGACKVAVAGGVNLYLHPSKYHSLCQRRMLAKGNKNYSFGAGDDGFVPGEGVGSVLLKPLSKAIADNDHIYAVVKGSAFAHGGSANGYAAPNPNSQASLIQTTLENAKITPDTIGYVEGHGTGTQLGDSLEIRALSTVFEKATKEKQLCAVGSVKSNIGHSESAAGIAGVTKMVLQMQHKLLVPTIHAEEENPNIDFQDTPFYLQRNSTPWNPIKNQPRRALINSFGAGGVNACLVLEEYQESKEPQKEEINTPSLVVLSAKNRESLEAYVNQLLTYIGKHKNIKIEDVAFTLQTGREAMQERLAFVTQNRKQLMEQLKKWKQQEFVEGVFESDAGKGATKVRATKGEQEYLDFLLEKQNLSEIAKMWVAGMQPNWNKLYATNENPKRISLPTYPFVKEHYWITDGNLVSSSPSTNHNQSQLHPLVSHNISTLRQIGFESVLTNSAFYATDHQVNGAKIFPGAGFLEMACFSGSIAGEGKIKKLTDIVWMHPLTVAQEKQSAQTLLKQKGNEIYYQVTSRDVINELIVHAEGKIQFQNSSNKLKEAARTDIELLKSTCPVLIHGEEFYKAFKESGITYGPAFQTIQELYCNDSFVLAKLEIPNQLKADFEQYILHPSIIDGALQAVAGLMRNTSAKEPLLPFAIDELEIIRPLTHVCYAKVVLTNKEDESSDIKIFTIQLMNSKGALLANIKNFYARALANTAVLKEQEAFDYV